MRMWLNDTRNDAADMVELDESIRVRQTFAYYELEVNLGDDTYLTTYFLPRSSTSVVVAACWEDAFGSSINDLAPMLSDEILLSEAAKAWPTFIRLLINGINEKYSEGAIARFEDSDTRDDKWFVVSILGNIDPNDLETIFTDRGFAVMGLINSASIDIFNEFQNGKPDGFQIFTRSLVKGVKDGLVEVAKTLLFMPNTTSNEIPTSLRKPTAFRHFEDLQRRGQ